MEIFQYIDISLSIYNFIDGICYLKLLIHNLSLLFFYPSNQAIDKLINY
jgi:hypothetical protein